MLASIDLRTILHGAYEVDINKDYVVNHQDVVIVGGPSDMMGAVHDHRSACHMNVFLMLLCPLIDVRRSKSGENSV